MKKPITFIFIILTCMACHHKPKSVDTEAVKAAVTEVLDKTNNALINMDFDAYMNYLKADGLYCGTDPGEFWNKSSLKQVMIETFPDSIKTVEFPLDKRVIRVSSDGKSAIAVEQYLHTDLFGPKLPMRIDYHLVNENGNWMIDFINMSLIPYNKNLGAIINALKQEQ